jgi:UTP-glucose-1-phosphate uridylyltransferase
MGSRYGGLKQVDPVGPGGETMLDYAVFDALRAGFDRVVFVIRRDFEPLFRAQIGARYAGRIAVDYAFQSVDALPVGFAPLGGREKPWGTGHAVWCAREAVTGNFAVINADDFYGADSFRQLGAFLRVASPDARPASFAMVGFRMANTLSEHGTVSRGVCYLTESGALESIVEHTSIAPTDVGPEGRFRGDEIVSMNCWAFTPALFSELEEQLREFLERTIGIAGVTPIGKFAGGPDPLKAEFYLPAAVSTMISDGSARVTVLPTDSNWFGITYREDKPRVTAAIEALVKSGAYPAKLF